MLGLQFEDMDPTLEFDFGVALAAMKEGFSVARKGWNGKGMFITLIRYGETDRARIQGQSYPVLSWIGMKTADDKFVPWLASQTDMLAEDWVMT